MGLHSGVLYALLGSTFTLYLQDSGVGLAALGALSLRFLPYSFKYVWAPATDHYIPPFFSHKFGQRKAWLVPTQALLIMSIIALALLDPKVHLNLICALSFVIAFLAATYDLVMEAYRIEIFNKEEMGKGLFSNVLGFRIGLIFAGAIVLYLSTFISWQNVFFISAFALMPCMYVIWQSNEAHIHRDHYKGLSFQDLIALLFVKPITELRQLPRFGFLLLLLAVYKLSDGYIDTMLIVFLNDIGFSRTEIATFSKTIGLGANILGVYLGSLFIKRVSLKFTLYSGSILAGISNLVFIALHHFTNDTMFFIASFTESVCSGFASVVFINFMSSLCNKQCTASQYALLYSIANLSKTLITSSSGVIVLETSWNVFFITSALFAIPPLICIYLIFRPNNTKIKV